MLCCLADVFEEFSNMCLVCYGLDPSHCFSSPGQLSWSGMLKMTAVKLIFVSDTDMYQFIEKDLKGGARYIA